MKLIIDNSDWSYEFKYDETKTLEEQNISEDAKTILAIIYFRYFAKENEKSELISIMQENDLKDENEKNIKYNSNNIFEKDTNNSESNINYFEEEVSLVNLPEKWYQKIFRKIKEFFKH
jgi:hypothetical protein